MSRTLKTTDITTDPQVYADRRPEARARVIPLRRERRVRVGDMLALSFENAETLSYQVQEMVYTERLSAPDEIAHEVELYSRLLPDSHSLTATLFVELTDPAVIKDELARLDGLQHSVAISVGGRRVRGEELPGPDEDPDAPGPLVSVHTLRFRFDDPARDAFRDPAVPAELTVDHPEYSGSTPITGATRTSLLADLALG